MFPIVVVLVFLVSVSLIGFAIYLLNQKIKDEKGLLNKFEAVLSVIFGLWGDPFSKISIGFLFGGILLIGSTILILYMLGFVQFD